jgi:ribosomal protein S6--L-glutamate ligase
MTHILALCSRSGWHVQDLARAAQRLDLRFDPVPFDTLVGRVAMPDAPLAAAQLDLARAGAVLVRTMPPGSLEQVVFRMDALHLLEAHGIPVVNSPRAVETAVDKYLALARLQRAGLPVPPTWVGESSREALDTFEALGGDVVVKPLFGSEGRGMTRLTDLETARRVLRALESIHAVLYLQKYIDNLGYDFRALVLRDRVLAAMRRTSTQGGWRANLAQGGTAVAARLDPAAERLALDAARAVGARLAGVDLLPAATGATFVLEVNAVPGWRGLVAATGLDVAAAVLDDLRSLAR